LQLPKISSVQFRRVPHENRVGVVTCAVLLRSGRWCWESRGVLLALVYMITRFVLAVVAILVRREVSKDVELNYWCFVMRMPCCAVR
jgi:hypothetical protein